MTTARPRLLQDLTVVDPSRGMNGPGDILIIDGLIAASGPDAGRNGVPDSTEISNCRGLTAIPGLIDGRVFIGEPGLEYRETIASASRAAAAGGVTSMIMMPDTEPVIDDIALVEFVLKTARDEALVHVHPAAALTKGLAGRDMAEIGLLREAGAVAFTNGRKAIADNLLLRRAMTYARDFNALVALETQDAHLAAHGVMNEGLYASWLGLPGIPREAEIIPLERDLRLAALTGVNYHAAKISVAQSADAIRAAKAHGHAVSCGVSINHLTLNENDIGAYRTFFRLSPPLRDENDRRAMVRALADGTIDIIVSSHDPQDVDTKRLPFADAADGAVGLETLLASALRLYHSGDVSLPRLVEALSTRPAQLFGLEGGTLKAGAPADIVLVDIDMPWILRKDALVSRSKNTAFEDARFSGKVIETMIAGRTIFAHTP